MDPEVARELEALRVRVRRLERLTGFDREDEPDTLPGIMPSTGELPVLDAVGDALESLGLFKG